MKKTFHYCGTHKEDEAYMQQMCAEGWAALSLTEGFWTFEECRPNEYCYRICYLRGKSKTEIEAIKQEYGKKGIAFVSRYSFWAIFRSKNRFELYTPEQEREICQRIYAPMPVGAAISWGIAVASMSLALKISPWFWILTVLVSLYGSMCTWLAVSYHKLIRKL